METDIEIFDDAWVFLMEGTNNVADYYLSGKSIPESVVSGWTKLLQDRIDFCSEIGARYFHVSAPEKLGVYPEKTGLDVSVDNSPASQIQRNLTENIKANSWINPADFLRSQKLSFKVYSKTDSHWNFYGAYSTYQLIQSRLGYPINRKILEQNKVEKWGVMDLGGKYDPPLMEKVYYYTLSDNVTRTYANPIVEYKERENRLNEAGLHVGSHVVFKNSAPLVNESLVLFGDSFSEYRGHLLTGMLAETYAEVHFIWHASLDKNLLKKLKPGIVITELAERFMPRAVPADLFRLDEYETEIVSRYSEQAAA